MFLDFIIARGACGEESLKKWGQQQKPMVTFGQAEEIANALTNDGAVRKETRRDGFVWRMPSKSLIDNIGKRPEMTEAEFLAMHRKSVPSGDQEISPVTSPPSATPPEPEEDDPAPALPPSVATNGDTPLGPRPPIQHRAPYSKELCRKCDELQKIFDDTDKTIAELRKEKAALLETLEARKLPKEPSSLVVNLLEIPPSMWGRLNAAMTNLSKATAALQAAQDAKAAARREVEEALKFAPHERPTPSNPKQKRLTSAPGAEPIAGSNLGMVLASLRGMTGGSASQVGDSVVPAMSRKQADQALRQLVKRGFVRLEKPGFYVANPKREA